jgi:hypothetical protein
MPIKPEFRHFYGREWRLEIVPQILRRAKNQCEECGVLNGIRVWRDGQFWSLRRFKAGHRVRIVLTVAHLNHVPGDNRSENLKALCQWCHLNHDKEHHAESRATRKDADRPLLQL